MFKHHASTPSLIMHSTNIVSPAFDAQYALQVALAFRAADDPIRMIRHLGFTERAACTQL
jgi:hypothetical protein